METPTLSGIFVRSFSFGNQQSKIGNARLAHHAQGESAEI
jgi:hypothetical protein